MRHCFKLWIYIAMLTLVAHVAFAQPGGRGFGGPGGRDRFRGTGERIELEDLPFELGVANIPDRETFEKLSYQGPMRMDSYLSDLEFVKFVIENAGTDKATVYWMNTENIQAHPHFMGAIGMRGGPGGRGRGGRGRFGRGPGGPDGDRDEQRNSEQDPAEPRGRTMRGAVTYLPRLISPDGSAGLYIFDFQPNDQFSFDQIKSAYDSLVKTMPFVKGKLAFHPFYASDYEDEKEKYDQSELAVHLDKDIYGDIGFLPLNVGESFGRLREMQSNARPSPRDIVICRTLPNEMPRVAGVITEVRQTPLSHVNLRAVQDKVPNAFVINALQSDQVKQLIGKYVSYKVTPQGYKLREATKAEVDEHFKKLRPTETQTPKRDLSSQKILPLTQIDFDDSKSFGVKAANLAAMHTFNFPEGTIPNGVAIPFYFYDEFMKHNGFYELVEQTLANREFQQSRDVQEKELKRLRKLIKKGNMPDWMMAALTAAQKMFPEGISIRCRSSTNNEDLPGFSGAGLYDSYTHHPREGHLSKSVKQVYASLWNFRAFDERDFYRVDHLQAAMGVLMHANFKGELANGVAVTDDILYETQGFYYINVQVGEDMITNPNEQSAPEEILLGWYADDGDRVMVRSNRVAKDQRILQAEHLAELRKHLAKVHGKFSRLYGKDKEDTGFAMEIEFKITKEGKLAIKQARPWVF